MDRNTNLTDSGTLPTVIFTEETKHLILNKLLSGEEMWVIIPFDFLKPDYHFIINDLSCPSHNAKKLITYNNKEKRELFFYIHNNEICYNEYHQPNFPIEIIFDHLQRDPHKKPFLTCTICQGYLDIEIAVYGALTETYFTCCYCFGFLTNHDIVHCINSLRRGREGSYRLQIWYCLKCKVTAKKLHTSKHYESHCCLLGLSDSLEMLLQMNLLKWKGEWNRLLYILFLSKATRICSGLTRLRMKRSVWNIRRGKYNHRDGKYPHIEGLLYEWFRMIIEFTKHITNTNEYSIHLNKIIKYLKKHYLKKITNELKEWR